MPSEFDIVICTIASPSEVRIKPYLEGLLDGPVSSIIIVVNGDDHCRESWEQISVELPRKINIVYSEPFSLSRARNLGVSESTSDWIVFLDDDAEPSGDSTHALAKAIKNAGSDVAVIGGRVLLASDLQIPRAARVWLSELDYGNVTKILDKEFVNGALLAVRRKVLEGLGGFQPSLGRQAGTLLSGEESLLIWQVREMDLKVVYCGEAVVTQHVPDSRLTLSFLAKRIFWEQVTQSTIRALMGWKIQGFPAGANRRASSAEIWALVITSRALRFFLG